MPFDKVDVVGVMDSLCESCQEYLDNLPLYESDTRLASLIAWCLAYTCSDYDKLPLYWHKAVGTLLVGLRLLRAGSGCNARSSEVTSFSIAFIEYLWGKHSRKYIALHSRGCWATCRFHFQQCYDVLWTVWGNLKHGHT